MFYVYVFRIFTPHSAHLSYLIPYLYLFQEELLSNTYTNAAPTHLSHLTVGKRVCAYWSEMISCLYPGTVTALYPEAGVNSKHLIDIEFDDGDRYTYSIG